MIILLVVEYDMIENIRVYIRVIYYICNVVWVMKCDIKEVYFYISFVLFWGLNVVKYFLKKFCFVKVYWKKVVKFCWV